MALPPTFTAGLCGQLPAARTTLYTAGDALYIVSITLVNTTALPKAANLYMLRLGGTPCRLIGVNTAIAAGALLVVAPFTMNANDAIQGDDNGVGAQIDYSIHPQTMAV